jgi:hypothetical protein
MKTFRGLKVIAILGSLITIGLAGANLPRLRAAGLATSVLQADGGCSLASLNGPYAVARQGTLVTSVPALGLVAPAPWAESAFADFNGAGAFSGKATVNIGGAVLNDTPFTGTYTVNNDCTGNATINVTNVGVTLHVALIVIGGGQRFIETETDSLAVLQGRAEKLGD